MPNVAEFAPGLKVEKGVRGQSQLLVLASRALLKVSAERVKITHHAKIEIIFATFKVDSFCPVYPHADRSHRLAILAHCSHKQSNEHKRLGGCGHLLFGKPGRFSAVLGPSHQICPYTNMGLACGVSEHCSVVQKTVKNNWPHYGHSRIHGKFACSVFDACLAGNSNLSGKSVRSPFLAKNQPLASVHRRRN